MVMENTPKLKNKIYHFYMANMFIFNIEPAYILIT